MKVRDVEIDVLPVLPAQAGTEAVAGPEAVGPDTGAPLPDEGSLRAACAQAIARADAAGAVSLALPAFGLDRGISPVVCGKILAQEAIRAARSGTRALRRIALCCADANAFPSFEKTVTGYLRHLLDVLIWGPFVTVDALIEVPGGIVLIKRRNPPLGYALPGGFVDYGESLEEAVRRESKEETGLDLTDLAQFHTYSDPGRDPRFHTISTVFTARASGRPRAGDDAAEALVVTPEDARRLVFAFDHGRIVADWLAGAQKRRPRQTL